MRPAASHLVQSSPSATSRCRRFGIRFAQSAQASRHRDIACILAAVPGYSASMQGAFSGWSRSSQVAALAAGALTCLMFGALVGVTAAGGHPQGMLSVFTDPVGRAGAAGHKPASNRRVTVTVTSAVAVASGAPSTVTVTQPATTVTETQTETQTETVTAPATTQAASSP
jgi:hypothetical protein